MLDWIFAIAGAIGLTTLVVVGAEAALCIRDVIRRFRDDG